MSWDVTTADEAGTAELGARLGAVIRAEGVDALLIDLRGELGAGKTVFVRGLGRALGVPAEVPIVSPTFTIARAYGLPGPGVTALHHLDAYRLGGVDDLEAAGFEDMCGIGCLTCVEWGGQVEDALPEDRLTVELLHATLEPEASAPADPETAAARRRVRFQAGGPVSRRVLAGLRAAIEGGTSG